MKMWVGVTDKKWYEYLASIFPDEVNFWKPGGQGFGAIEMGAFLGQFKNPNMGTRNGLEIMGNVFYAVQQKIFISITTCLFQKAEQVSEQIMSEYFV